MRIKNKENGYYLPPFCWSFGHLHSWTISCVSKEILKFVFDSWDSVSDCVVTELSSDASLADVVSGDNANNAVANNFVVWVYRGLFFDPWTTPHCVSSSNDSSIISLVSETTTITITITKKIKIKTTTTTTKKL